MSNILFVNLFLYTLKIYIFKKKTFQNVGAFMTFNNLKYLSLEYFEYIKYFKIFHLFKFLTNSKERVIMKEKRKNQTLVRAFTIKLRLLLKKKLS